MSTAAVETIELTRQFGAVTAVDALNLTVAGEVFGLLGPNGAGKTTTIKMLHHAPAADLGHRAAWPGTTSSPTRAPSGATSATCPSCCPRMAP